MIGKVGSRREGISISSRSSELIELKGERARAIFSNSRSSLEEISISLATGGGVLMRSDIIEYC